MAGNATMATVPPAQQILDALVGITRQIGSGRNLETVFGTVAVELAELLPYDRCSVGLLEPDGETFRVIGLRGRLSVQFRDGVIPLVGTNVGWVVAERRPLLHEIGVEDRFKEDGFRRRLGLKQMAIVPILVDDEPIGALGVSSVRPDAYHAGQLWILQTIADHLGLAVAATNLRRDAERRAARSQFLAETAEILASSLDLEQTMRRAVGRAAGVLGDLNAIYLRDEETGDLLLEELTHPDPAVEAAVREHGQAARPDPNSRVTGPALRGESVLIQRLDPTLPMPGMRDIVRRLGIHSVLAVPLMVRGRVIGVLSSACTGRVRDAGMRRGLTPDDLGVAQDMAAQVATAIDRARLHAATQRALDESEALRRIGQELASSIELDRTLDLVASFARLLLGADYAAVAGEGADGSFAWRAMTGNRTEAHREIEDAPRVGAVGRAMTTRQVVSVDPLAEGSEALGAELAIHQAEAARAVLAVPLLAGERAVGALVLGYRSGHVFTPADARLAASLAAQAAMVLENARLFTTAQRALASRDEFLSIAAHELRTPLTTLRGRAQLLQRRLAATLPPQDLESLRIIRRQLDRLTRMVNDLLDVSRLTAGRLLPVPERVDLVALTRSTAEEFATPQHPIAVATSETTVIGFWDPWRLEQVLANVLSNAMRYSPPGTPITMHVEQSGGEARVAIVDKGVGLAANELERIFERFYRGEQQDRAGFGLGLSICRQIIADHGGRLWATSAGPGQGTTFTITLPLPEGTSDETASSSPLG